jgi:hypothetical protein
MLDTNMSQREIERVSIVMRWYCDTAILHSLATSDQDDEDRALYSQWNLKPNSRIQSSLHGIARLTLKGEAGAELVAGLVELLGIERATNTESQTGVDLGVVGEGCNAEVVDLGLCREYVSLISYQIKSDGNLRL